MAIVMTRRRDSRRPRCTSRFGMVLVLAVALGLAGCSSDKKPTATNHPSVTLLAPNGGEHLYGGIPYPVTWTAQDPDTPAEDLRIALEYSSDGGSTWNAIAQQQPNTGSYAWEVPVVVTNRGRVRITATDGENQGSDQSDATFNISPAPPEYVLALGRATGVPETEVQVPLDLTNAGAVRVVHADVLFDPGIAELSGVVTGERAARMDLVTVPAADGTVTLDLQASEQDSLEAGDGAVAILTFRLVGANHTETSLTLARPLLLDTRGDTLETTLGTGLLTIEASGDDLVAQGWSFFTEGEFNAAERAFDSAIAEHPGSGPAYVGQGWCRLDLATGPADLELSVASFDSAFARGESGADALSGRAAASLGLGGAGLPSAVTDATAALQAQPEFVFVHRSSFDAGDLHLIEAFARIGQGDVDGALAAAEAVQASGIRRDDPASWTVDGTVYGAFEAAVLAWLHKLSALYSG
jgi:hypothetical protein